MHVKGSLNVRLIMVKIVENVNCFFRSCGWLDDEANGLGGGGDGVVRSGTALVPGTPLLVNLGANPRPGFRPLVGTDGAAGLGVRGRSRIVVGRVRSRSEPGGGNRNLLQYLLSSTHGLRTRTSSFFCSELWAELGANWSILTLLTPQLRSIDVHPSKPNS
jgi:hypothetical protein